MRNLVLTFATVFLAYLAYTTAAPAPSTDSKEPARLDLFLARLAGPLKRLALEADALSKLVENESILGGDKTKRQGWDMDYGLGGGRFGKKKRYDLYSFGTGRFGRDVDHVDIDHHVNQ